eukprot:250502-Chlamydomonas_euryale.AAC.4
MALRRRCPFAWWVRYGVHRPSSFQGRHHGGLKDATEERAHSLLAALAVYGDVTGHAPCKSLERLSVRAHHAANAAHAAHAYTMARLAPVAAAATEVTAQSLRHSTESHSWHAVWQEPAPSPKTAHAALRPAHARTCSPSFRQAGVMQKTKFQVRETEADLTTCRRAAVAQARRQIRRRLRGPSEARLSNALFRAGSSAFGTAAALHPHYSRPRRYGG